MALKPVDMALKPVNIALNVAQTPFRLARQVVGGVVGGGGSDAKASSSKPKDLDDVTIARKVESEVFRDRRIAKGKVDIDVVNGVVSLRGQARTPALVKLAERRALVGPGGGQGGEPAARGQEARILALRHAHASAKDPTLP